MQERRYRPGDVLDDYCPRERRITDHAIVAMIDNEIRRTRCGICDAEHEYKEAKVPSPRRKTQPPALFTQVLDGLQGPTARPPAPAVPDVTDVPDHPDTNDEVMAAVEAEPQDEPEAARRLAPRPAATPPPEAPIPMAAADDGALGDGQSEAGDEDREEGPIRRSLIRAQFPKVDGQVPTPRAMPEFTIQSLNNRNRPGGSRPGGGGGKNRGRRRPGAGGGFQDNIGPMRTSRDNGAGGGRTFGQGDQRGQGGQGQGQGHGGGGGRRRRRGGGKKTS